jgi:hypothetical protein
VGSEGRIAGKRFQHGCQIRSQVAFSSLFLRTFGISRGTHIGDNEPHGPWRSRKLRSGLKLGLPNIC